MSRIELNFKEENWEPFADLFPEPSYIKEYQLLKEQLNNNELAKVIWGQMEKSSLNWINRCVPALEGLKPIECLAKPELVYRLKECLLRMQ